MNIHLSYIGIHHASFYRLHYIWLLYFMIISRLHSIGRVVRSISKAKIRCVICMDMYGKISLQQQNVNILMSSHCGNHLWDSVTRPCLSVQRIHLLSHLPPLSWVLRCAAGVLEISTWSSFGFELCVLSLAQKGRKTIVSRSIPFQSVPNSPLDCAGTVIWRSWITWGSKNIQELWSRNVPNSTAVAALIAAKPAKVSSLLRLPHKIYFILDFAKMKAWWAHKILVKRAPLEMG